MLFISRQFENLTVSVHGQPAYSNRWNSLGDYHGVINSNCVFSRPWSRADGGEMRQLSGCQQPRQHWTRQTITTKTWIQSSWTSMNNLCYMKIAKRRVNVPDAGMTCGFTTFQARLHLMDLSGYRTTIGLLLELFVCGSGSFRVRHGIVDRFGFS